MIFLLTFLSVSMALNAMGASGANNNECRAYNWYCMKTKSGEQPPLPSEFGFITENNGYYLDKCAEARGDKVIYLTFDCGYENGNVERILDILKAHNAPAAFFVLSNIVKRDSELISRMNDDGHFVCNHTASHRDMTEADSIEEMKNELDELDRTLEQYCGFKAKRYYRPPEGRFNKQNLIWASELGFKTVFWSCAYDDWDNGRQMDCDKAMNKLLSRLHNGEVLLLHPTSKTNADILDGFLTVLEGKGYRFGTLDELTETT